MEPFSINAKIQINKADHPIVLRAFDRIREVANSPEDPRLKCVSEWLDKVLMYNVPHGKRGRLLQVVQSFETFTTRAISAEELEEAAVLGWIMEILQSMYLIMDDMMDKSVTRRGSPCWYLVDEVGLMAVNDALLLQTLIFDMVKDVFQNHPSYVSILELLFEVLTKTTQGQCLDMLSEKKQVFTEERYEAIILYKTAFYSFSTPIRLGMLLSNISAPELHQEAEKIALKIGKIFQIQDDFLDCYGDPAEIGKVGTDIVDAKCSWLLVKALQTASPDQRTELINNIGRGKPGGKEETIVRSIYRQIQMEATFRAYEESAFKDICEDIARLELNENINVDIFKLTVNKIFKRRK